jgi:hypothetical protein
MGGQGPCKSREGKADRDKGQSVTRERAQWVYGFFFPNLLKKEAHCCLEQKGEATHPELLGKAEGEAKDWTKREFPGSMHEGLLVITAVQVNPAQGQYWSTGSKG